MKLTRQSLDAFNPEAIVRNPDIFSRKNADRDDLPEGQEDGKSFTEDGIFSEKIFGRLNTEKEFSCECGKTNGKMYEGMVCPYCNNTVIEIEANIDKVGWIDLEGNYVIKYIPFQFLEKIIGRENLFNICKLPNRITLDGDVDQEEIEEIRKKGGAYKYWHYGNNEFYKHFEEILEYYLSINYPEERESKYLKDVLEIIGTKDTVFTDKIPVISTVLRPALRTAEGIKMDEINIVYINILTNAKTLRDNSNDNELSKSLALESIQAEYFILSQKIFENVKTKYGLIRNQICGTRINFSSRNIISPAIAGYKMDEVVLPYLTFLNLYKFEIINIISRIKNVTYTKAERLWFKASLEFNEEIYKIMKKIIVDEEVSILLNRNPSISFGSILYIKVAGIKHNFDDMTMSVHNSILSLLNGDYDGDVLNIVSLKDTEMKEIFKEVFSPINLLIDPNTGDFNILLNLERDQVLGMNNLLT